MCWLVRNKKNIIDWQGSIVMDRNDFSFVIGTRFHFAECTVLRTKAFDGDKECMDRIFELEKGRISK
jgi:hypothetical protein